MWMQNLKACHIVSWIDNDLCKAQQVAHLKQKYRKQSSHRDIYLQLYTSSSKQIMVDQWNKKFLRHILLVAFLTWCASY